LGRQRAARGSAFNSPAKAKTVTVAKGQRETLARFLISLPNLGPVSDQRAEGRGDGVRKKAKTNSHTFHLFGILPGVCGKSARTGFGLYPGSGDLPQSPAKVGAA